VIWIKHSVRKHLHKDHTENVHVLEGNGLFTLGEEEFAISSGSHIVIPKGVVHSVTVLEGPMKVISIRSPEFEGSDRIFLEEKE